jgi:hypothetical protein
MPSLTATEDTIPRHAQLPQNLSILVNFEEASCCESSSWAVQKPEIQLSTHFNVGPLSYFIHLYLMLNFTSARTLFALECFREA